MAGFNVSNNRLPPKPAAVTEQPSATTKSEQVGQPIELQTFTPPRSPPRQPAHDEFRAGPRPRTELLGGLGSGPTLVESFGDSLRAAAAAEPQFSPAVAQLNSTFLNGINSECKSLWTEPNPEQALLRFGQQILQDPNVSNAVKQIALKRLQNSIPDGTPGADQLKAQLKASVKITPPGFPSTADGLKPSYDLLLSRGPDQPRPVVSVNTPVINADLSALGNDTPQPRPVVQVNTVTRADLSALTGPAAQSPAQAASGIRLAGGSKDQVNQQFQQAVGDLGRRIWASDTQLPRNVSRQELVLRAAKEILEHRFITPELKAKALKELTTTIPVDQRKAVLDRLYTAQRHSFVDGGSDPWAIKPSQVNFASSAQAEFLKATYEQSLNFVFR